MVAATAQVKKVLHIKDLTRAEINKLKNDYNHLIGAEAHYYTHKTDCRYAVLIWLEKIESIAPVRIDKNDWRAWVVLNKQNNFGLL